MELGTKGVAESVKGCSSESGIMVFHHKTDPREGALLDATSSHADRIQVAFDDHCQVANAGLMLRATLGETSTWV